MAEYSVVLGVIVLGVVVAIGFFGLAVAGNIDVATEKITTLIP